MVNFHHVIAGIVLCAVLVNGQEYGVGGDRRMMGAGLGLRPGQLIGGNNLVGGGGLLGNSGAVMLGGGRRGGLNRQLNRQLGGLGQLGGMGGLPTAGYCPGNDKGTKPCNSDRDCNPRRYCYTAASTGMGGMLVTGTCCKRNQGLLQTGIGGRRGRVGNIGGMGGGLVGGGLVGGGLVGGGGMIGGGVMRPVGGY